MPAHTRETPSYSSSRVQRAYRINNIEQHRLQGRLQLLDKEKVHNLKLANQDIRLISVTLDYIQSCSGHSPEAMEPVTEEEETPEPKVKEKEFFMYGERIVSRKVSRFRRPQSAVERSSQGDSRRGSVASGAELPPSPPKRPQSSPVKRAGPVLAWMTSGGDVTDTSVGSDGESDKASVTSYVWTNEPSEMTKKIFRAQELRTQKRSVFAGDKRSSSALSLRSLSRQLSTLDRSASPESQFSDRRSPGTATDVRSRPPSAGPSRSRQTSAVSGRPRRPSASLVKGRQTSTRPESPSQQNSGPGKGATLSELLTQRRPTLSANAWRSHLNKNRISPISAESHRQQLTEMKMRLNENRQQHVQTRLNNFLQEYPVKRTAVDT